MDKLIIGYLEFVILLLMGQFPSGVSDLFSCRFEDSNTCSIRSTAWITETGRDWENNEQGAYYVTNRHTENGIKGFPLPSLRSPSSSSTTVRLSFYFKFYGHTTCSILIYIGRAVKFEQIRSSQRDSSWKKAPNIDFICCCPSCPSIDFLAICNSGTGGVAVDDVVVSAVKTNRTQNRLAVIPKRKTMTSLPKQATTPATKAPTTLRPTTTKGSSRSTYGKTRADSPRTVTSALEKNTMSTLVGECTSRNTSSDLAIPSEVSRDSEKKNNTKSESPNPTIPSASKWSLSRRELKIVLPVLFIIIIGIVIVCAFMLSVKMRRGNQKKTSNSVNAARSCDVGCQGSDKLEDGYEDPRQLDIKLEIRNQECPGHHYIPMNPIPLMEQSTDADEVPVVIYESIFYNTERSKGPKIYENEHMNSGQHPHLYANFLLSDFADTAEVIEDDGYVSYSRGQKQDASTPCSTDASNDDSTISHDQCMKEDVHNRHCNYPNPTYTPYNPTYIPV